MSIFWRMKLHNLVGLWPIGRAKILFPRNTTALTGPGPSHYRGFKRVSDHCDLETSIWQQTTLTKDRHSRLRRDSKPQSQKQGTAEPRLGPRGHLDQRSTNIHYNKVGLNPELVWTLRRPEKSIITARHQNSVSSFCSVVLQFPGTNSPVCLPCRYVTLNVYVLTVRNISAWILRWNDELVWKFWNF